MDANVPALATVENGRRPTAGPRRCAPPCRISGTLGGLALRLLRRRVDERVRHASREDGVQRGPGLRQSAGATAGTKEAGYRVDATGRRHTAPAPRRGRCALPRAPSSREFISRYLELLALVAALLAEHVVAHVVVAAGVPERAARGVIRDNLDAGRPEPVVQRGMGNSGRRVRRDTGAAPLLAPPVCTRVITEGVMEWHHYGTRPGWVGFAPAGVGRRPRVGSRSQPPPKRGRSPVPRDSVHQPGQRRRLHLGPGHRMVATKTPPDHREGTPPPLLRGRMVARHQGKTAVQPGAGAHDTLPLPGDSDPNSVAGRWIRNYHTIHNGTCGAPGARKRARRVREVGCATRAGRAVLIERG